MTRPPQTQICNQWKWRVIPFFVCFFLTVGVLLGVYRARTGNERLDAKGLHDSNSQSGYHRQKDPRRTTWEEGHTNDRWVIISDDQDIRYVCSVVDVAAELEWRTLVVGHNVSCCTSRKSCVLYTSAKMKMSNFEILSFMSPKSGDLTLTRRNVAYLYAIYHGARHIFDAYPETYVDANIDVDTFRKTMTHQLQNAALNVALGLVRERPYVKRVQNPYAHFGRPELWTEAFRRSNQRYLHNHIYRICEVRPPSIEKFLETDEGFFDWAAPALTLPGSSVAPFSSKNTLYSIEAFWGLMLLPGADSSTLPAHLLRTIWNQALLGEIAGSLKLSLNTVPTINHKKERMAVKQSGNTGDLREPSALANRLLKWSCPTRSSLACIRHLFQNMHQLQYVTARGLAFVESWISDLQRSHYLEPPIIPRRRGSMNPCLGADGLYGVAFYPALPPHVVTAEQEQRRNSTLQRYLSEEALLDSLNHVHGESHYRYQLDDVDALVARSIQGSSSDPNSRERKDVDMSTMSSRHAKLLESFSDSEEMPLLREFTDLACPGYSHLLPHQSQNPTSNVLLIVAMNSVRYDLIPMFEVIYREQFRNILYCGDPHESIEIFLRKYQLSEDRSFSFLPIHTKYTYECVLGAIEMGFNVDGYIMTSDDALINSWNIPKLNTSTLWYGGDYNIEITAKDWRSLDPGSHKLPRSLDGVLKVLEFLKSSLIGSTDDKPHHHQRKKRGAEAEAEAEIQSRAQISKFPGRFNASGILVNDPADEKNPLESFLADSRETIDLGDLKSFRQQKLAQHNVDESNRTVDDDYHDLVEVQPEEVLGAELSDSRTNKTNDQDSTDRSNSTMKIRASHDIDEDDLLDLFLESEDPEELEDEDEEPEAEEESETERPVSELLHQLLVATRHNSTVETELVTLTNSSSSVSYIIPPPPPPPEEESKSNTTVEPTEKPEESMTGTTAFTISTTPATIETDATNAPVITPDAPSISFSVVPPSVPSVILPEQPATVTESHPQHPPTWSTEDHKESSPAEEEQKVTDSHVSETLATLQEIYTLIQGNLGVPNDPGYEGDLRGAFYGGDRAPYRLNPKSIHHFHCEKGNSLEFCKVSSDFLYQLSENTGKSLRLIYDDIPMYFIPRKDQLKFYLLSNLMLQHGVTDEIAIPLIVTGLSAEEDWLKLGKSHFGALKTNDASAPTKYPLFDPYAVVLHPADLNTIRTDPKIHKIFCLKYLLRILQF